MWKSAGWGTAVGLAGALGGWLCALMLGKKQALMQAALEFAAGVMLAVVCFQLLPESFGRLPLPLTLILVTLGMGFVGLLRRLSPGEENSLRAAALMAAAGIAMHNLPEGLAIGAGWASSPTLGWELALTILLHDIPEGIGVALPLRISGAPAGKVCLLTLLSGTPTGLGALLGAGLSRLGWRNTAGQTGACLAFAAGAMLWVTLNGMLPVAFSRSEDSRLPAGFAAAAGILAGAVTALLLGEPGILSVPGGMGYLLTNSHGKRRFLPGIFGHKSVEFP